MNYTINLNSVAISLKNCHQKHIEYFNSQFFLLDEYAKPKLTVEVTFTNKIAIPQSVKKVEENMLFDDKTYVLDTKKRVVAIDFSSLSATNLKLSVENNFDLYYLYTFLIEPLFIIFGLSKGLLFVHSSAVAKDGKGFLFPAWRHTGKTQTLLSLTMQDGYEFMGDDYTIVDKKNLYLYPKKINLFSYNLKEHPSLFGYLDSKLAVRLKITTAIKDLLTKLSYNLPGMLGKVLFRVAELAEVSTNFKTEPSKLGVMTASSAKLTSTALLQASVNKQPTCNLTKKLISYKLSETVSFELFDFFNMYSASCYVTGMELNSYITTFRLKYAQVVSRYIHKAHLVYVDEGGMYYDELEGKHLQ